MDKVSTIKTKIRKALKNQRTYTKDLETCIGMAAGSYYTFLLAQKDIEKLECTYVIEYSREDKERLAPHPAFKVMKDSQEMTRKSLKELGLTLSTLISDDVDEFNDLVKRVSEVE